MEREAAPWSPDAALVRKKFEHYDKDSSGNLDEEEILALAQVGTILEVEHGPMPMHPDRVSCRTCGSPSTHNRRPLTRHTPPNWQRS